MKNGQKTEEQTQRKNLLPSQWQIQFNSNTFYLCSIIYNKIVSCYFTEVERPKICPPM